MPTPNPRRICSYCKYHNHEAGNDAKVTCRVNPPTIVPKAEDYNPSSGETSNFISAWPVVNQDVDWCGRWVDEETADTPPAS